MEESAGCVISCDRDAENKPKWAVTGTDYLQRGPCDGSKLSSNQTPLYGRANFLGGREIHRPTSLAVYKEKQSPADPKEPPLQAVGHRLLLYQQSSLWIPEQGKVLHLRIVFQNCKSLFSLKAISELLCNTEGEKKPFSFPKKKAFAPPTTQD